MIQPRRAIKPDGIEYWVDDRPPWSLTLMLAFQQVAFLGSVMTLPVVLGRAAGLDLAAEASLVALTMIGAGLGVMLQALNRFGVGIGLFVPMHTSSAAFPTALMAVKTGGLGLAFGMMSVVGFVQICFSRVFPRMRAFFPVEIAGLMVFMLGLGLGLVGLENFLAIGTEFQDNPYTYLVGFSSLAIIIGLNIWGRGHWCSFSVFIGLLGGQLVANMFDLVPGETLAAIQSADYFSVPSIGQFGWSFDWRLIPDFIIVGLVLSLNSFGVLTIAQRANDSNWKRPDVQAISRGILAEGLINIICSFTNSVTQTSSGGAVGLSQASGVTSRVVAFVLGGLFVLLAFFPPVTLMWSALSPPAIGATLMFVASFIAIGGLKILTSRLLDNRKVVTLGLAIVAGLGHDTLLTKVDSIPSFLDAALSTSVSVTVLVAILLNALFRLGSQKKMTHTVMLDGDWGEDVNRRLGHSWSARPEVVARLEQATNELIDTIYGHKLICGEPLVRISVSFDEYQCQLTLEYQGEGFNLPEQRPDPEELLKNPDAVYDLAGYLVRRLADSVKLECSQKDVRVILVFHE